MKQMQTVLINFSLSEFKYTKLILVLRNWLTQIVNFDWKANTSGVFGWCNKSCVAVTGPLHGWSATGIQQHSKERGFHPAFRNNEAKTLNLYEIKIMIQHISYGLNFFVD